MADFYLDHNVPRKVAAGLRSAGHDAVTAKDFGYEELADDRHLWVATRARRIFLTHDSDARDIHINWRNRKGLLRELPSHGGILILLADPIWEPTRMVREVVAFFAQRSLSAGEAYEWVDGAWATIPAALDSRG